MKKYFAVFLSFFTFSVMAEDGPSAEETVEFINKKLEACSFEDKVVQHNAFRQYEEKLMYGLINLITLNALKIQNSSLVINYERLIINSSYKAFPENSKYSPEGRVSIFSVESHKIDVNMEKLSSELNYINSALSFRCRAEECITVEETSRKIDSENIVFQASTMASTAIEDAHKSETIRFFQEKTKSVRWPIAFGVSQKEGDESKYVKSYREGQFFVCHDSDTQQRVKKALEHLIKLKGGKPELF